MNPIPIATSFTKYGWIFTQLKRSNKFALYECKPRDNSPVSYEVIRIEIRPSDTCARILVALESETFPAPEMNGVNTWSFSKANHVDPLIAAVAKFDSLQECPTLSPCGA